MSGSAALAAAGRLFEAWQMRRGASGAEATQRRVEVRERLEARVGAARAGSAVVEGHRVVVLGTGKLALRPFELSGPVVLVEQSAISPGTERAQWLRLPNAQPPFPYVPGYSAVGHVLDADGHPTDRRLALLRTGHQSVAALPRRPVDVPASVTNAAASLAYLGAIAALGIDVAGDLNGKRVAVLGQGTIGALATRLVATLEPTEVIAVAATDRRCDDAVRHGAHRFVLATDAAHSLSADIVIEASGATDALRSAIAAVADGGVVVLLGSPRGQQTLPLPEIARRSIELRGAHIATAVQRAAAGSGRTVEDMARWYLECVAGGQVGVDDLLGPTFDPRELPLAYRALARSELGAARLDWHRLPSDLRHRRSAPFAPPRRRRSSTSSPVEQVASAARPHPDVRVALIGCGDIGVVNGRAIAATTGFRLVVCHDQVESSAAHTAERLGCDGTDALDRALDPDAVDLVVVATPHDAHESVALAAIERGLHVVVEKPLAHDLASARRIVEAAERAGVVVTVSFPYREFDSVRHAGRLIAAGALGEVRSATISFHADKPESYWFGGFSGRTTSDWRFRPERAGGGVLIMNMTHYIDLIVHLTGRRVVAVSAVGRGYRVAGIEDTVAASLELEGGTVVALSASSSTPGGLPNQFHIVGEDGTIRLEPDAAAFSRRALDGLLPTGEWTPLGSGQDEPAARNRFYARLANALATGSEPDVTADDALHVQAVVEACYRSIRSGTRATIAS